MSILIALILIVAILLAVRDYRSNPTLAIFWLVLGFATRALLVDLNTVFPIVR